MAKKRKKKRKVRVFVYTDQVFHTTYLQDKKTGKMRGRKYVKGLGDRTAVRRVRKGPRAGQIFGRTPPIKVRGSRNKRGGVRKSVRRL